MTTYVNLEKASLSVEFKDAVSIVSLIDKNDNGVIVAYLAEGTRIGQKEAEVLRDHWVRTRSLKPLTRIQSNVLLRAYKNWEANKEKTA